MRKEKKEEQKRVFDIQTDFYSTPETVGLILSHTCKQLSAVLTSKKNGFSSGQGCPSLMLKLANLEKSRDSLLYLISMF